MIKQAELEQAYSLGRQAALEKLAGEYHFDDGVVNPGLADMVLPQEIIDDNNRRNKAEADRAFNRAYPTAAQKKDLQRYTDQMSSGMRRPSRIGNVRVFSTPQDEKTLINEKRMVKARDSYSTPKYNEQGRVQNFLESRVEPYLERKQLQALGPSVHPVGSLDYGKPEKRVMYLPSKGRFSQLSANPILRAHEYYHATDPDGMGTRAEPNHANAEHRADLYAGLTDFDLKDVARLYLAQGKVMPKDGFMKRFGNPVYSTPETKLEHDPHLDDQSRYSLFAGMAR